MRPGVAALERQTVGKAALETEQKRMVSAGANIALVVDRTVRDRRLGIVLVERRVQMMLPSLSSCGLVRAEIYASAGKQSHAPGSEVLRRRQKIRRQFVFDGQPPGLDVKVAAALALQGPRMLLPVLMGRPLRSGMAC